MDFIYQRTTHEVMVYALCAYSGSRASHVFREAVVLLVGHQISANLYNPCSLQYWITRIYYKRCER